jgi:propanediol dehydratase small subunit
VLITCWVDLIMSIYGMMDGYHGDEEELESIARDEAELYEAEHENDWRCEEYEDE